MIRQLRQGLGGADADGDRNAGMTPHGHLHVAGIVGQAAPLETGKIQKRLVDAVALDLGREGGERVHDAAAHVAVEGVIRAQDLDAVTGQGLAVEVIGIAHLQAEGFGLVAAGDEAAIVVRQHDHRASLQGRRKTRSQLT